MGRIRHYYYPHSHFNTAFTGNDHCYHKSVTAICGLIPLALNPNPLIAPLAIVFIGGLTSSTVLSRILTPVMYKLIPPHIETQTRKIITQ